MLREIIDISALEDFASGMARTGRVRVCLYDDDGRLLVSTRSNNEFARLTGHVLTQLPAPLQLERVPAHDPPGHVAFVESHGVWYVVAPIYIDEHEAGYVGVGEYRVELPPVEDWTPPDPTHGITLARLRAAWEELPTLDRGGAAHEVITARWGARQLAAWGRRESRLLAMTDEVALVGDIAELLTGEADLQEVLDRIVLETARVMDCPYCTIRLYDARTQELTLQSVHGLPHDYLQKGLVTRTTGTISDEALRGHIVYVEDAPSDPRVLYPDEMRRAGIASMLTAGMIYRGNPVGLIRVYTHTRRRFRKAQRDLLRAVAYQAATAVVHAQLVDERLRNATMQRQLELAGDLQERMIRVPPPRHPALETAVSFDPTYEVAGDFCDFLTLPDGRLTAVVGDVAGKGVPASLLMSAARGALRAMAETCGGPGELLTRLNRQIERDTLPGEFMTVLLAAIDPARQCVTYASAGHEPLLILRAGEILPAEEGDLVLGIRRDVPYREHTMALLPGDLLLLYTDGAIEARNFHGEEFGRERLWHALRSYGAHAPSQLLQNIVWDIRRFVGLAEQSDDLTLVAVRLRPPRT
ncbi:MAG: SpoIIE family protein phosphatase [Phycisphaerales bacterium]|nr:SpoIIE family protein phosphatase [Phycisphaerales bacterium]